eukprot:4516918-Pyramimonas_sp.AAC.1
MQATPREGLGGSSPQTLSAPPEGPHHHGISCPASVGARGGHCGGAPSALGRSLLGHVRLLRACAAASPMGTRK